MVLAAALPRQLAQSGWIVRDRGCACAGGLHKLPTLQDDELRDA